jgi:squalene-hopene/tetraprenyl-beta-curcumene cyclase
MVERFKGSDGLGAIYPPMMYAVMALDVLGYPPTHPLRVEAVRQFDALMIDGPDRFFFQPCYSPIWDSAIAAYSLGEAQAPASKALSRCADWIARSARRATGPSSVPTPNRPAGHSNTTTSTTPISMTPRWCCSPSVTPGAATPRRSAPR